MSTIKNLLNNSYTKSSKQKKSIDGFERDSKLSGTRAQVYHNPATGKTIVSHTGTNSIMDIANDAALTLGLGKHTKRYRHAKKIQREAAHKYGKVDETIGHSLGGYLAQNVGGRSEVTTVNKASAIGGHVRNKNQTDIRAYYDPVSIVGLTDVKHKGNQITYEAPVFSAHSLSNYR